MLHDPRKLLEDMRRATGAILQFTAGRTLDDYSNDLMLRSGIRSAVGLSHGGASRWTIWIALAHWCNGCFCPKPRRQGWLMDCIARTHTHLIPHTVRPRFG